jgi:hypothetical protein
VKRQLKMSSKTKPIHVLRGILHRLKVKTDKVDNTTNSATKSYIMEQYRLNKTVSSPEKATELRKLAFDYFRLKTDLAERERLYEIDAGADVKLTPKELSRRAAARAGLQLPDLDPDLEKDLK